MRILVLNPNSSLDTTRAMEDALAILRAPAGGPDIVCETLAEGPPGIETQEDVESVVLPVARYFKERPADAYVIACFSDPGLYVAREMIDAPVVGIAESAFFAAVGLGPRFGIIAILETSIPRHLRHVRSLGLENRLAGDRAIGVGVGEMSRAEMVVDRIVEAGTRLRDEDGADVLILGCASMGRYRPEIERRLGMPVVDPVQAGVSRCIGLLSLGYRRVA